MKELAVFSGALAKLRKVTISSVMSVRLSVCTEQLDVQLIDKTLMFEFFFRKCVQNVQVLLKSEKNNATLLEDIFTVGAISR